MLNDTSISNLNAVYLINLEQLSIERTGLMYLDLSMLSKLQVVWGCMSEGLYVITTVDV